MNYFYCLKQQIWLLSVYALSCVIARSMIKYFGFRPSELWPIEALAPAVLGFIFLGALVRYITQTELKW